MHAHIPNPRFMVMAEMSTFGIFCGRNVPGRNVQAETSQAEMSEHRMNPNSDHICYLLIVLGNSQAPRSGLIKPWPWSGSKLFDNVMVSLSYFFF